VRDNALCRAGTEFDAETRKIRRVAQPESDDDAANKLYVEQSVKILRDRQEEIEKNIQTFKVQLNRLEKKMTTIQNNIQTKTDQNR